MRVILGLGLGLVLEVVHDTSEDLHCCVGTCQ